MTLCCMGSSPITCIYSIYPCSYKKSTVRRETGMAWFEQAPRDFGDLHATIDTTFLIINLSYMFFHLLSKTRIARFEHALTNLKFAILPLNYTLIYIGLRGNRTLNQQICNPCVVPYYRLSPTLTLKESNLYT